MKQICVSPKPIIKSEPVHGGFSLTAAVRNTAFRTLRAVAVNFITAYFTRFLTQMMMTVYVGTGLTVLAYLLGSFASAVVVCKILGRPDPRTVGSGNPGATNVLRHAGKQAALLTLLFDVFKGLLPVLLARLVTDNPWILGATALAAFLGHLFPIFFSFRGGKGVATGFGVFLGLAWPVALAMLLTWLGMASVFRYSSLAALITAGLAPAFMWQLQGGAVYIGVTVLIAGLLIWRHRSNIVNLWNGKEDKIGTKE